jgi:tetratricopeptide (TPR) repeat protein
MEDYDIVNDMINSSWLIRGGEGNVLQIHPVIADVIRSELKPDTVSCRDYVLALGEKARHFWGMDTEERDALYPLVTRLLTLFPRPDSCGTEDDAKAVFAAYGQFANSGWICGDFERSKKVSREYYDCALSLYGPGSLQAGLGATYTAGAYYNSGDWVGAGPWYELSFRHQLIGAGLLDNEGDISSVIGAAPDPVKLDELSGNELEQLYAICTRIARNNVLTGNYERAQQAFDLAVAYADARIPKGNYTPGRKHPGWYAGIFLEQTRLYLYQERWQDAYNEAKKTLELMEDDIDFEEANMGFPLIYLAKACSHLGRFDEADKYLERAEEITDRLVGRNTRTDFHMREAKAENLLLSGKREEGISELTVLLLDMEKHLGENNQETIGIREKLEKVKAEVTP